MKAISIRQPWAWLIVAGLKDIENRTWATRYRGPIAIHAAKGMTRDEYEDVDDFVRQINRLRLVKGQHDATPIVLPDRDELERGGIIGVAELVACVPSRARRSFWHMEGQYGFEMRNARPVPFIPYKGQLNIFDVPDELLMNQCDGCRVRAPMTDQGNHAMPDGGFMGCTAHLYGSAP